MRSGRLSELFIDTCAHHCSSPIYCLELSQVCQSQCSASSDCQHKLLVVSGASCEKPCNCWSVVLFCSGRVGFFCLAFGSTGTKVNSLSRFIIKTGMHLYYSLTWMLSCSVMCISYWTTPSIFIIYITLSMQNKWSVWMSKSESSYCK